MTWKPGEIVIVVAGAIMFIASFLTWYDFGRFGGTHSSWSSGLFPIATLIPIVGTLMALQIVLTKANALSLDHVGDFTWEQLHLVGAVVGAVLAFCWLVVDRGSATLGAGFFLEFFGAIALVVGVVLLRTQSRGAPGPA